MPWHLQPHSLHATLPHSIQALITTSHSSYHCWLSPTGTPFLPTDSYPWDQLWHFILSRNTAWAYMLPYPWQTHWPTAQPLTMKFVYLEDMQLVRSMGDFKWEWKCRSCSYFNNKDTLCRWWGKTDEAGKFCIMCNTSCPHPWTVRVDQFFLKFPQCSFRNDEDVPRAIFRDTDEGAHLCIICYTSCPQSSSTPML